MRRIAVQRHTAVVLLLTKHYMSSYHCCLRNPACMLDNLRQHRSLWGFSHYSETEEPSKASRKLDRSKQITCCARLLLLKKLDERIHGSSGCLFMSCCSVQTSENSWKACGSSELWSCTTQPWKQRVNNKNMTTHLKRNAFIFIHSEFVWQVRSSSLHFNYRFISHLPLTVCSCADSFGFIHRDKVLRTVFIGTTFCVTV